MSLSSGVNGLDDILFGGLVDGRAMLVMGGPGSGKTMLGMQFLAAAPEGEPGLLLSFEESPEELLVNSWTLTFPFAERVGRSIDLIDGRPPEDTIAIGTFDLNGLIATLEALVQTKRIRRVVIDAIDVLFTISEDRRNIRSETLRLLAWLNASGLSALLTMKTRAGSGTFMQAFDFAEFAVDCVLQLESQMHGKLVQRTVRIVKRRGAPFIAGQHAYTIGERGLRVMYSPIRTIMAKSSATERCSTGVERLDRMLSGGFLRGTTALISGLPGSSKTTFAAAFLAAGCAGGEQTLFVGFDEPADQMIRNVESVGIKLRPFQEAGLLRLESFAAGSAIADDFYLMIEDLILSHRPMRIVVDPISALLKAGGAEIAENMIERLVILFKGRGLSAVFTSVSEPGAGALENTPTRVSTVADTWIHLSFAANAGERNRLLTIVKSRGTGHSAQTREVMIDEEGITLADVYEADGEVLFGTARLEREQQIRAKRSEDRRAVARELQQIDEEHTAVEMRREQLNQQLAQLERRRDDLAQDAGLVEHASAVDAAALQSQRRADPESATDQTGLQ